MNAPRIALLSGLFFLAAIPAARADLPPPDGYVEECTVDNKEQPGTQCEACKNGPGGGGSTNVCIDKYTGTKFAYVCKTWGASFWTEVWCDGPPRPDEPAEEEGCSCAAPGLGAPAKVGIPVAMAMFVLLLGRRRRSR